MDHPLDENVVEPDKYAFLLGCSLRENNLEQFFSVYDAILPKHLSESQLDKIKERARQISELPQDKFDVLVLSARDYSLAQGRPLKMSGLDRSTRGPGADDWNSGSEDEEDGTELRCRSFPHGDNFTLLSRGTVYAEDGCERDSGLPSSGKGAGSWCENDVSDSEDRGVIHYFPNYESSKRSDSVKISETDNPDFDEAHDVESDKSSIESPRSDVSSTNEYNVTNPLEEDGIEMKTFNREDIPQFRAFNIHQQLYNRRFGSEIPYTQLRNDCDNDGEVSYGSSYQQRKYMQGHGRSVDDTVCFQALNKRYPFSQSLDEAESGGFQKHDSFYNPPFGSQDPLKAVGNTINNLIGSGPSNVSNMPPGADIHDEARKKRNMKKKKGSKDDGDDRVSNSKARKSYMNHDENGNPIDINAYRQMREIPNKTEGSTRKHPNYGTYNHHGDSTNFDSFPFHGQVKDLEDGPSNSDRKKLRKKTHREPVKLAQDIPNYVGDIDSVDDLVKFIETGEKQVKKKASQKTSPSSELLTKADKVIKRKEKKVKVGQADEPGDSRIAVSECGEGLHSPTPSTSDLPVISTHLLPPTLPVVPPPLEADGSQCSEEDMGNSGDKSAAASSVEVDSQSPKSEDKQNLQSENPVVLNKDCEPPSERISSSKSPPLHKKDLETKDKNKSKAKEKEKSVEAAVPAESKKQKGKNGKSDLQLKNNKKLENKNDIINNTKTVDKMKIENGPIKVVSKLESDELGITDNHQDYIFTDIDNLPPVEQEFTLVSKKKKRQGAKDIVAEIPRQKNGPREYRGLPAPRSVTPPPPSLLKKEQSRDLSPSSFPALGKKGSVSKGRPTFREGRRNSFGDVPIDTLTELRSQDDSDIESVKSLPAAKGGSLGDVVSSRFPVSYAKMAAAPKPPNSPTSPKAEEEDEDDEEMSDAKSDTASSRKPTVWKGSPTERRHSIGSSPEDSKQENSPKFTQRSRQKSGSQEFLHNVESVKSDVDMSVPDSVEEQSSSVSVNEMTIVSSSSSSEVTVSEELGAAPSPGSKELSPETQFSPSSDSKPIPSITITPDSNKVASVKNNNQNGPKIPGPQGAKSPELNFTAATATALRSQPAASSSSSSKDPSRGKTVSAKVINNSRKNNKSVIFLDKRFGDEPENLGITFGFDSNFEQEDKSVCDIEPANTSVNEIVQEAPSCNRKEPVVHNQIEAQSVPVTLPPESSPKAELSSNSAPGQVSGVPQAPPGVAARGGGSTVALPGSTPPPPATSSTSNKTSSKTRVGGLNGVVMPKTQGYRNRPGSEALRTERVATSSSEPKGATAAVTPASTVAAAASNKDNNKTVLFFYGEGIKAKIGNSDVMIDSRASDPPSSSQHKGQLAFSQDANHKGKFNVNEAAKFLKQEWERVLEQQEKNPQAVMFYNGQ